jgi:tetratricopeptide (TPR) repeat protein
MSNKINNIKRILYSSLEEKRLGRALAQAELIASGDKAERLSYIKDNYQRLLNFYIKSSTEDPNRDAIFKNLIKDTYELIDDICAEKKSKDMSYNPSFSAFWQENRITEELKVKAKELLHTEVNEIDVCLSVSAITISCIEVFDAEKIILLIKFSNHKNINVSTRAFVGLLICLQVHKNRYSFYPNINNELNLLFNSDEKILLAQTIYKQLIRTKETEKLNKEIQDKILPVINKIAPKLSKELSINKDNDWDEEHEDIHQMLENSGISKKIENFHELMQEGSDTNFRAFSSLKNMHFFQNIENWVMPFNYESKELDGLRKDNPEILDLIDNIMFLCDSDKYSFCLILLLMPSNTREALTEQLQIASEDTPTKSENDISNHYIQDLYRFYKLYKGKEQLFDPFGIDFDIYNSPFFRFLNEENVYLSQLADFYFSKEQYQDALNIFTTIGPINDLERRKKLGFCYQKLMRYPFAIRSYEKCDIIEPDNIWTNKSIAYCYMQLYRYDSALQYYKIVDSLKPNDFKTIYNMAICYTQIRDFENGLNMFNKLEYLEEEEEATHNEEYYLYKGDCLWASGYIDEAIENYKKYPYEKLYEKLSLSMVEFTPLECTYICDYIRYNKN